MEEKIETPLLNLSKLTDEELMDFFNKVDEHIKYLNNNILTIEEEEQW